MGKFERAVKRRLEEGRYELLGVVSRGCGMHVQRGHTQSCSRVWDGGRGFKLADREERSENIEKKVRT